MRSVRWTTLTITYTHLISGEVEAVTRETLAVELTTLN